MSGVVCSSGYVDEVTVREKRKKDEAASFGEEQRASKILAAHVETTNYPRILKCVRQQLICILEIVAKSSKFWTTSLWI